MRNPFTLHLDEKRTVPSTLGYSLEASLAGLEEAAPGAPAVECDLPAAEVLTVETEAAPEASAD